MNFQEFYSFLRILDVLAVYKQSFDAIGYDVVAQQVQDNYSNSSSYNHSSHIQCSINPDVLPIPNSYRLHISSQKVIKYATSF